MNEYEEAKNIAGVLIQNHRQKHGELAQEDIAKFVETASVTLEGQPLGEKSKAKLRREFEIDLETVIGAERAMVSDDEGWEPWLLDRKAEMSPDYWGRYKTLLSRGAFNDRVLSRLESSTDRVLDYMGNPAKEGAWDRRGLVCGLVQSGKTSHYVGLINKALDSGYKVVIVLTGFTESLRVQTQDRVEKGVLGYSLRMDPNNPKEQISVPVGVDMVRRLKSNVDPVTTLDNDFKTGIAKSFAISVGETPLVFVVKKNATVLRNLLQWIRNSAAKATDEDGRPYVKGAPLLLIDDESDVGSIDTKKGAIDDCGEVNPDQNPSTINKQIRKLLSLFDQSSYVGYTATPFANVLIHDLQRAEVDTADNLMIGEDLFPRSFIVSLPTPDNHVGPSVVFGGQEQGEEALPIIRYVEDTEIGEDKDDYWIPASHKSYHQPRYLGEDTVPPSLREAMLSFILAIAARRLRGDIDKDNSMLVHVTRFKDVQRKVSEQVEETLQDIVQRLRNRTAIGELLKEMRALWEDGDESFRATTRRIAERPEIMFQNPVHHWELVEGELLKAVSSIEVRIINGETGDVLDYDRHEGGLNVIAIGGEKLARGLTLNGLSVSYFLRCSRMYDTLMQMGRWFGYRPGYLDLCRLYTTSELTRWFGHISEATEELRREFDVMSNRRKTPKQFGLKVQAHSVMSVTSAVKMRTGIRMRVSFQGTLVQTIDFDRRDTVVRANWEAGRALLQGAGAPVFKGSGKNTAIWSDIPGEKVVGFLEAYTEQSDARTVRTQQLKEYIEKQIANDGLVEWTVALSGGEEDKCPEIGGAIVRKVKRKWNANEVERARLIAENHYRAGVITNPPDELLDLDDPQRAEALRLDIADWEASARTRRGRKVNEPTEAGGRFSRQVRSRERGLLIFYPINPSEDKAEKTETPILGFAISFPEVGKDSKSTPIDYITGNVFQRNNSLNQMDDDH